MNWDDKAKAESYDRFGGGWDDTGQFADGAEWQREQMRIDEAVERVARGLYDAERGTGSWEWLSEDVRAGHQIPTMIQRNHLDHARAALDALLGNEPRP